jgi:hypothetical protein
MTYGGPTGATENRREVRHHPMARRFCQTDPISPSRATAPAAWPGVVVNIITPVTLMLTAMEIVRGIFLKGSGISTLWPQMLALLVFGLLVLTTSVLRFHKRLD